jgi:hypothetical protein
VKINMSDLQNPWKHKTHGEVVFITELSFEKGLVCDGTFVHYYAAPVYADGGQPPPDYCISLRNFIERFEPVQSGASQ